MTQIELSVNGVSGKVTATLSDCVKQATITTLGAICGAEPVFRGSGEDAASFDGVIGIISFVGDVPWSLMLGLPRASAESLALKFAGFEIPFDSADMGDVVGELANVLAGDISARLENRGLRAQLSLPTVARGRDVQLLLPEGQQCVQLAFTAPQGSFWLKLVIPSLDHRSLKRSNG